MKPETINTALTVGISILGLICAAFAVPCVWFVEIAFWNFCKLDNLGIGLFFYAHAAALGLSAVGLYGVLWERKTFQKGR